jgi:hypothetical protein
MSDMISIHLLCENARGFKFDLELIIDGDSHYTAWDDLPGGHICESVTIMYCEDALNRIEKMFNEDYFMELYESYFPRASELALHGVSDEGHEMGSWCHEIRHIMPVTNNKVLATNYGYYSYSLQIINFQPPKDQPEDGGFKLTRTRVRDLETGNPRGEDIVRS